ncbi:MAG: hypothetical protein GY906_38115, partial [bacterium]|nr:hypothetical protein [bacterium]
KKIYTVEAIRNARSTGFLRQPDIKVLYPRVDLSVETMPLVLGKLDRSYQDVEKDGVKRGLSSHLGDALGTRLDTFNTSWEFLNGVENQEYVLEYVIFKTTHDDLLFTATSNAAEILEGGRFEVSKDLLRGGSATWRIRFRFPVGSDRCAVLIGYEFTEPRRLASTDVIRILEAKN